MAEKKKPVSEWLPQVVAWVRSLITQSDHAQNNSAAPDYIKNRTHYVESVSYTDKWNQSNVEVGSGSSSPGAYSGTFTVTAGNKYRVIITNGNNSKTYTDIEAEYNSSLNGMLLNKNWSNPMYGAETTSDAFCILVQASSVILSSVDVYGSNCTVQVSEITENVKKLDRKYLPALNEIDNISSSKSGSVTTVTITETEGATTSFQISDGANGTNGTNGTDGKSAYQVAVDNGFVGTEAQWLASLKGDSGVDLGEVAVTSTLTNDTDKVPSDAAVYSKVQRLNESDINEILSTGEASEPTLPIGYTELEWIYNENGSSGIDTGLIPDDTNWRFVGSWARMKAGGAAYAVLFSSYKTDSSNCYRITRNNTVDTGVLVTAGEKAGSSSSFNNVVNAVGVWNTFDLSYGTLIINGSTKTVSTTQGTANTDTTLKLLNGSYYARLKTFQAYHNDVLVGNFVPAKRDSDGEIGMYDTVTDTFFEHINANAFTAGPEVPTGKDKVLNGEGLTKVVSTSLNGDSAKLPTVQAVKEGIEVWRDNISYIYSANDLNFDGTNYVNTEWNPYSTDSDFEIRMHISDLLLDSMSNSDTIISCIKQVSPYPGFSIRRNSATKLEVFINGNARMVTTVNKGVGSVNTIIFKRIGLVYTFTVNETSTSYTYPSNGVDNSEAITLYIGGYPDANNTPYRFGKFKLDYIRVATNASGFEQGVQLYADYQKRDKIYPQTTVANLIGSDALFLPVQSFYRTLVDYRLSDYPTLNPLKGEGFTLIFDKPIGSVNESNLLCLYNNKDNAGTASGTDFFYINISGWQYQLHLKKNGGTEWSKNYSPGINGNSCLIAASFNLKTGEVNFFVNGVKTLTNSFSVDNTPDFGSVNYLSVAATNYGRVRTIFNGCITDEQAINMLNLYPNNIIKKSYENIVGFGKRLAYRNTTWSITNGSIVGTSDGNFQITMTSGRINNYVNYSSAFLAPELLHYCKITAHLSITEVSDTFTFSGFGINGGHKATIYDENGDVVSTGVGKALNVGEYDLECYDTLKSSDESYLINWECTAACKFTLSKVYVEILGTVIDLSPYTYRVYNWKLYNGIQLPISSSAQFNTGILRAPIVTDATAPEYPGQLRFYNNNVYIGYIQGTTCVWKQISN